MFQNLQNHSLTTKFSGLSITVISPKEWQSATTTLHPLTPLPLLLQQFPYQIQLDPAPKSHS